jgi:hypothetical protein
VSSTRGGIVPDDALLVPNHWLCRLRRHRSLRWTEGRELTDTGALRTFVTVAQCFDCGRNQARVRVVYPPARTINVTPSTHQRDVGIEEHAV